MLSLHRARNELNARAHSAQSICNLAVAAYAQVRPLLADYADRARPVEIAAGVTLLVFGVVVGGWRASRNNGGDIALGILGILTSL